MYKLIDFKTKKEVASKNLVFTGERGPWEVRMDIAEIKKTINQTYFRSTPPSNAKYLSFMPIKNHDKFVTLSEGGTPLIPSRKIGRSLGIDLYFKYEAQNPTGAFKDRGSAVEATIAKELGAKAIIVASTGNMAASCACYAAAANIPCFVIVPEGTPSAKLAQVISYGGKIVQVKGTYNDAVKVAKDAAENLGFYLAGDYAFRVEGQKTAAFEICDQLFFDTPDYVIVPMGCGTNITSYGKGFREYSELGFIKKLPRLIGVQAEGASAVVNAFKRGKKDVESLSSLNTIASAIAVNYPLDGARALYEISTSHGEAYTVNDQEMLEAQYNLAKEEGLYVEVSSASSLAILYKLFKQKKLFGKKVVCVLTGNGLKDSTPILKIAIKPPTIYPDIKDFLTLYKNSFFEGKSVTFTDKNTVLFSTTVDIKTIKMNALKYFNVNLSEQYIHAMHEKIREFLKKGKAVTFSDFQDILQDSLEQPGDLKEKIFKVLYFTVTTSMDKKPHATVSIELNGEVLSNSADGTGPVDAVISALRKAAGSAMEFTLNDYNVDIRASGTDAVVHAEIKLSQSGMISLGQGVSPDIIQASIEAFENAYNGFY